MTAAVFDPRVAAWFARRYGEPTEVQRLAWPRIAAGEHVLATAPTGSGKTLTAFLWPLERLLTGAWPGGALRVLYVSPLKALNADIERNLEAPLAELRQELAGAGEAVPSLRVAVRSGDTPAGERTRLLRRPPEILITTPESLNLLLLAGAAGDLFAGLRLVVLDEIHAVAGGKRGTHLITAVDRLVRLAGEFQRVAMSATVRPLERVARFVGGWRLERGAGGAARYVARPVAVVAAPGDKRYDLRVRWPFPPAGTEPPEARQGEELWRRIAADLERRIAEARSTIVFTNSRRLAEKTTRYVNDAAGREVAWSHHGSLAREIRTAVERRLKEGSLPAIVATSSLELGIDVGALERVLLVGAPASLASSAQRVGRAGHGVGETSRAIFYPTHARDFLACAVAVQAVVEGEIEPLRPVRAPLDLLAQTVLACVARERWRLDDLYDFLRASDPFHELPRPHFDLVVEMLAGRYADARIEELKPRVALDRVDGTIEGRPGVARLLARAGGTIPDRGYFQLKLDADRARLGELDEEFVWERKVGDAFLLGTQAWRIQAITANEVFVVPARGGALLAPFWRADARDRGSFYATRLADLLERADRELDQPAFASELEQRLGFEPAAAAELIEALRAARAALGGALPHRHHLVFEEAPERGGDVARRQVILYTFWGGTVNRPLAMALAALWEEREGGSIETLADDDAVLLVLPPDADPRALLAALDPARCEELLRARLEATGFFGAHFRQNAQRALLLPRAGPARRTPLWISRQNAKKLLEAVARHDDFPLVLETWRTCLQDEFELGALRERLLELARGEIRVSSVRTEAPSPLAASLLWRRTNELVYEDDVPSARRASGLRGDLLREVALAADGRPAIPRALVARFDAKAQRVLPGYAPRDATDLLEWVKERFWIPAAEWRALLAAIDRDRVASADEPAAAEMVAAIADKLVALVPEGGIAEPAIAAVESHLLVRGAPPLERAFARAAPLGAPPAGGVRRRDGAGGERVTPQPGDAAALGRVLGQWLRFYGAVPVARIGAVFGLEDQAVAAALAWLVREEKAIVGALLEPEPAVGGDQEAVSWAAALSSFETLLRWKRAAARAGFEPLPLDQLPLLAAAQQGLIERGVGVEGLQHALERLFGAVAPAGLWERELLPARLDPYQPAWLDALFEDSDLVWYGAGRERVGFAFRGDLELVSTAAVAAAGAPEADALAGAVLGLLGEAPRGAGLAELAEAASTTTGEVGRALWSLAWSGAVACDSMKALRQGVLSRFEPSPAASPAVRGPGRRSALTRWQASRPFPGRWFRIAAAGGEPDPLREEERNRERVRLLLDRWGVLCRDLLALESPAFSWARLARTMRALELAGEIVGGRFVAGLSGLQFAAPATVARLGDGLPVNASWWQNAADPCSLAGAEPELLRQRLPRRLPGNQVVWVGARVAAVIRRSGRELDLRLPAAELPSLAVAEPYRIALTRAFDPERGVEIETVDGEPAATSPQRCLFDAFAVTREGSALKLRRRWS